MKIPYKGVKLRRYIHGEDDYGFIDSAVAAQLLAHTQLQMFECLFLEPGEKRVYLVMDRATSTIAGYMVMDEQCGTHLEVEQFEIFSHYITAEFATATVKALLDHAKGRFRTVTVAPQDNTECYLAICGFNQCTSDGYEHTWHRVLG